MRKLRTLTEWSAAIKARDCRCLTCGATTALVAHHVKPKSQYPELKYDLDNGVTLCVDCHRDHHREHPVVGLGKDVIGRVALKKRIKVLEEVIAGKTRVAKEMFKLKVETEQYDDVIAGLKLEISNLKDNNAKLELRLSFCKKQIADLVKKISF
jgi:hypothetical protein